LKAVPLAEDAEFTGTVAVLRFGNERTQCDARSTLILCSDCAIALALIEFNRVERLHMKTTLAFAAASILLSSALSAVAQEPAKQDSPKPSPMQRSDDMKNCANHDGMSKEMMAHCNAMKKDQTAKDSGMRKGDAMKGGRGMKMGDGTMKDCMTKDCMMKKDAMPKDDAMKKDGHM